MLDPDLKDCHAELAQTYEMEQEEWLEEWMKTFHELCGHRPTLFKIVTSLLQECACLRGGRNCDKFMETLVKFVEECPSIRGAAGPAENLQEPLDPLVVKVLNTLKRKLSSTSGVAEMEEVLDHYIKNMNWDSGQGASTCKFNQFL